MDRRIDDVRPQQGLEWDEVIFYDADHTERNMFASSDGEWVRREVFEQQASTIAALKEQVSALQAQLVERDSALHAEPAGQRDLHSTAIECLAAAARICEKYAPRHDVEGRTDHAELARANAASYRAAIRALASQPAAPVQPLSSEAIRKLALDMCATDAEGHSEEFNDGRAYGVAKMNAALMKLAAPPVQQPDDVRDPLAEFTAYVVKNYPANTIIGDPAWHAPRLFRAAQQALATTRPSAALTDSDIEAIGREWAKEPSHFEFERNDFISAVRAILAASGGALAVPEGYAIVPTEPSAEMIRRGVVAFQKTWFGTDGTDDWKAAYVAMISAAPAIPAQGQTK